MHPLGITGKLVFIGINSHTLMSGGNVAPHTCMIGSYVLHTLIYKYRDIWEDS